MMIEDDFIASSALINKMNEELHTRITATPQPKPSLLNVLVPPVRQVVLQFRVPD